MHCLAFNSYCVVLRKGAGVALTADQPYPSFFSHGDYKTGAWQHNAEIHWKITALFMPHLFEPLQGYSLVRNISFLPGKRANLLCQVHFGHWLCHLLRGQIMFSFPYLRQ